MVAVVIAATVVEGESRVHHFVSLVDYVCLNPLHDENETHERMFLYALTLVDVVFNMKVSAAVVFSKCSFQGGQARLNSYAFLNSLTSHKSNRLCLHQSIA